MAKKEIEKKAPMPDGVEPDGLEIAERVGELADVMSREEALWKARELLRKEAQGGLNRRLGINPKEIVGVRFLKSWRNYFADGNVYGFSKKAAAALVKSGVAVLDGDPDPRPKVTAQDEVDAARARRAAKAQLAADEKADAQGAVHEKRTERAVDAAMKAEAEKKVEEEETEEKAKTGWFGKASKATKKAEAEAEAEAEAKKKAEEKEKADAALEAEFDAALKAELEAEAKAEKEAEEKAKADAEAKKGDKKK